MKSNATRCGNVSATEPQRDPRRPVYKISFCLKGPSRTPVPTGFGENFDILLVGEDIILPLFIKISLRFAQTTTWQAASFLRKHCGRPYRFGGGFDVAIVGTGVLDCP